MTNTVAQQTTENMTLYLQCELIHRSQYPTLGNPGFPSGKHNQAGAGVPHLRPMNINSKGEVDMSVVKYVQTDSYKSLARGDVLFNNTNSPALLGKTALITRNEE